MSAFSGAQGFENLSSAQQRSRGIGSLADNGFARLPSAPPSHLSVVVSLPPQSNAGFRGSLHNVGAEYKHAVHHSPMGGSDVIGDALMGSRLYMIRLGTMKKVIDGMSSEKARYTVVAHVESGAAKLKLQQLSDNNDITIHLSDTTDDYSLGIGSQTIAVKSSFPVPDSVSSAGRSQHPFYTFSCGEDSETLQWQIEPLETGPLRYTLVQVDLATVDTDEAPPKPESIRATYHHIGQAPSLSLCNGE